MYNNLLFSVKKRILDEVSDSFVRHPAFSKKVEVVHKFPYEQRLQYGVVLRSTSASQIRMSPDNYLAELKSHVRLCRVNNKRGLGIEWVRENSNYITKVQRDEDVSNQVGPTQRRFFTSKPIMAGKGNTNYADNVGQIQITINGVEITAEYVNGEKGLVMLSRVPAAGDVVKISYYYRVLSKAGIYIIDFEDNDKFSVYPVFIIRDELVIDTATGTETSVNLANQRIYSESDNLYMQSKNGGSPIWLIRGTDYDIDLNTGEITFLNPLQPNFSLYADYQHYPSDDYFHGPYEFKPFQEVHDAIPGIVLCLGRKAEAGDEQAVILSTKRGRQAKVYGGHWEMALSLAVISKDPSQMEQMSDHIVNYLWGVRKNQLEYEGITLNTVEPSGEAEEPFIDTTGDQYYESSVEISVMTEWQYFIPYEYEIRKIPIRLNLVPTLNLKEYEVDKNNNMIIIHPDKRKVLKIGSTKFERVF